MFMIHPPPFAMDQSWSSPKVSLEGAICDTFPFPYVLLPPPGLGDPLMTKHLLNSLGQVFQGRANHEVLIVN